jgi:osmotically-inducible protein OsmY
VVYLLGLVSDAEGEAAAQVAARTAGVRQVVTLFDPAPAQ